MRNDDVLERLDRLEILLHDVITVGTRNNRLLVYLCQEVNPVVLGVDDISDLLPPKRKKSGK